MKKVAKTWSQWKLFFAPPVIGFGYVLILFMAGSGLPLSVTSNSLFLLVMIALAYLVMAVVFLIIPILLIVNTIRLIRQGTPAFPTVLFPIFNVLLTFGGFLAMAAAGANM